MKIGFDARYAQGDLVGVGKYIRSLVMALSKKNIKCVLFYSGEPRFEIKGKNIESVILETGSRYYFEQILLPSALKKHKVDLYHAMGNMGVPVFCPVPAVLTIHDIIPLEIENYFSYSPLPSLSYFSYLLRFKSSIYKAAKIVTVSNYVKKQLEEKLNVPQEKIQTIYSGAPEKTDPGKLPEILSGKKYILNHGGIDIRKNIDRLIRAFSEVHKKHKELYLVITGANTRIKNQLEVIAQNLNVNDFVIFTGYLNDETLSAVIKSAELICYPTLSEGFGFPVLEGFSFGIPVVSSKTSSIPEVSGEGALLIDPYDVKHIAKGMEKVLTDSILRKKMVLAGKEQYNRFNWEKAANEYLDLYNHI